LIDYTFKILFFSFLEKRRREWFFFFDGGGVRQNWRPFAVVREVSRRMQANMPLKDGVVLTLSV